MLTYYVGVPRSGKTYRAVKFIYDNFSKHGSQKTEKKYNNCYTNIAGLKLKKLKKVYRLDFDILETHIVQLHQLYKKKASDYALIELCKELDLYKTFFVIDEAHNYFDVNRPHLVWWLSYHGHLYHDIILITQNLSLIHSKYKGFAEFFYQTKPLSIVLGNRSFKYKEYTSSRLSKLSLSRTISVKKRKEVFDLYVSGDTVEVPNIYKRFFIIIGVAALAIYLLFKFFILKDPVKEVSSVAESASISHDVAEPDYFKDDSDQIYLTIFCSDEYCVIDNHQMPIDVFSRVTRSYDLEIIKKEVLLKTRIKGFYKLHVLINNDYKKLFVPVDKDKPFGSDFGFMRPKTGDSDVSDG